MEKQVVREELIQTKVRRPKQYKVIMYNDDYTTMEFVIDILVKLFKKNVLQAEQIMTDVHKQGQGVAGIYPYDLATTKAQTAMMWAREEGFPFKLTVEEA